MGVTRLSFAASLLHGINAPVTDSNLRIVVAWTIAENGAPQFAGQDTSAPTGSSNYNPLGCTLTMLGSTNSGGGLQSYVNWSQGLQATISMILQSNMSAILTMLQQGDASPQTAAATIDGSPWGTHDLTAGMIQSANVKPDGGQTISGLITELTGGNPTSASLWVVGSEQNPDMDYWTCINQYAMSAQLYCFSDGNALYVADGLKLMSQTPTDVITLLDPRLVEAHLTYDNTTFNYTHHALKKGNVVRRAALARTTSPTECEIKIICEIDKYRGGDLVVLQGFGQAADGPWLVGECRRSIFAPFSTLTLVQAMAPLNAATGSLLGPAFLEGAAATARGSGTVINAMVSAAADIDSQHIPYEYGGGHAHAGQPDQGDPGGNHVGGYGQTGFDCSGAVAAVLAAGGLWVEGSSVPASNGIVDTLLAQHRVLLGAGHGIPECTLYDTPDHIFMRLNGEFWGTADGVGNIPAGSSGGGWIPNGQPGTGFRVTHVPPFILGEQPAQLNSSLGGGGG